MSETTPTDTTTADPNASAPTTPEEAAAAYAETGVVPEGWVLDPVAEANGEEAWSKADAETATEGETEDETDPTEDA